MKCIKSGAFFMLCLIAFAFFAGCEANEEDEDPNPDRQSGDDDDGGSVLPDDDEEDPDYWEPDDDSPATTTTMTPDSTTSTTTQSSTTTFTTTTTTTSTTTTTMEPVLLWVDDFESYPTGDLKDMDIPWKVVDDFEADGVRSKAQIVDMDGNKKLDMLGLTPPLFFVTVRYAFEEVFTDMKLHFDLSYDTTVDIFEMEICRKGVLGAPIPTAEIHLDGGRLYAKDQNSPGLLDCGPIYSGNVGEIEIRLRFDGSYDVLINGSLGECRDMTQLSDESSAFAFIRIMDPADDGAGGYFLFDEFEAWATSP